MADPALGASRMPQRLEQVLKQIAQADTPMLVSSSGPDGRGKPMRVQHLLDDSSASQLYERVSYVLSAAFLVTINSTS